MTDSGTRSPALSSDLARSRLNLYAAAVPRKKTKIYVVHRSLSHAARDKDHVPV